MSAAYQEYLELFEYFGRGGMVRLGRAEFEALAAEFDRLVALQRPLTREQIGRVAQLKALLLRDRPKLRELATPARRTRR
jgi:hypothetical protein